MNQLKKLCFGNAHFEVARGTDWDNICYCAKDGHYVEFGEVPQQSPGKRNDILEVHDMVKSGKTDEEILAVEANIPTWVRYRRGISDLRRIYDKPQMRPPAKVVLIYGRPGSGKSTFIAEKFPDAYWKDNTKWWPYYAGESTVVWDEFTGGSCTPSEFNRYLDRWKCPIEIKNDHVPLKAYEWIIISNFLPNQWWPNSITVDLDAILRRIGRVYWFRKDEDTKMFDEYEDFEREVTPHVQVNSHLHRDSEAEKLFDALNNSVVKALVRKFGYGQK